MVLDVGCTRSISKSAIKRLQEHSWYFGISTEQILLCSKGQNQKLARKVASFFFQQNPTCSTIVDVLETSGVQLDPQGDNVFCSHFSRCVLHNGTHCAGNMSFFPCQSENPAYLAHFLGTFEDEDKDGKLFVRPTLRGS